MFCQFYFAAMWDCYFRTLCLLVGAFRTSRFSRSLSWALSVSLLGCLRSASLVCSRTSAVSWRVRRRDLHNGRGRGTVESCMVAEIVVYWPGQHNHFAPAAVGCPVCSTSRGQPPTWWCDLWRCREMITKLLFEGVRRGIPGPTPSTGTNPTTGRGVSPRHPGRRRPPNFYSTGTNPRTGRHWTAFLCPVIRRR